jgi:hypothetical protein
VVVGLARAGHVRPDDATVRVRVILVLDPARPTERSDGKPGDVARGEDLVAPACAPELVHEDAVVDLEAD